MVAAVWIFVLALWALWSLAAWGLYRLLRQDGAWLGELAPLLDEVPFAEALERWVPGWRALAELTLEAVQWALGALGAAAPVVVWLVWGVGTLALALLGALLALVARLMRETPAAAPAPPPRPPALPPQA